MSPSSRTLDVCSRSALHAPGRQTEVRAREDAERAAAATKKWLHQTQGELMNAQGALVVKVAAMPLVS